MEFALPQGILGVLEQLESAGYEAYLVGGCVRDRQMGILPKDYDITTSALPEEMLNLFERVITTGIAHGTVTVLTADGPVEVTTYRLDGEYSDHRHPDGVQFTRSLREDLARRDFTMNAMAMDAQGALMDPFGGRADMEKGIIRAVGEPSVRFEEDALRILRGLRFAARLGFAIEQETALAMQEKKHLLKKIAAERIFAELCGLLEGEYAAKILKNHRSVIEAVLPEMGEIGFLQKDAAFGFATLLIRAEDPAAVLNRFKPSNAFKQEVLMLIKNQDLSYPQSGEELHRLAASLGADALRRLYAFRGWGGEELEAFLAQNPCLSIKDLAISGKDLMALGLKGAAIGQAQEYLLEQVMGQKLPNQKESLIQAIKKEL